MSIDAIIVKTGGKTFVSTIVDVALSMTSPWAEVDTIKITFKHTDLENLRLSR